MSSAAALSTRVTRTLSHQELDPLSTLAVEHGTDKYGAHFYTPHYHRFFAELRSQPVTLLEAGVGGYADPMSGGESLAMWRDYFPLATIVGIDVAEKRLDLGPRVTIRRGSMADPTFLAALGAEFGPFDIIIDDGSHISHDTIRFFEAAFPLLADGGFFAIEDTQTSYFSAFGGSLSGSARTTMNFVKQLVDDVDHAERRLVAGAPPPHVFSTQIRAIHRFHNLVLFERGDNLEPSNFAANPEPPQATRAALAAYERLLDTGGGSVGTAIACSRLLRSLGDDPGALARLDEALQRFPSSPQLLLFAAEAAQRCGDVVRAGEHLRQLLSADNDNLDALVLIAESSALRGHFKDIATRLERRAGASSDEPRALLRVARALVAMRLPDRALHWLDRVEETRGRLGASIAAELAATYRRLGRVDRALAVLPPIDGDMPLSGDAVHHGAMLYRAGRYEEAVDILTITLGHDWNQPRAHAERCRALAALGRDVEAMEAAKAFLASSQRQRRASSASC